MYAKNHNKLLESKLRQIEAYNKQKKLFMEKMERTNKLNKLLTNIKKQKL